MKITKMKINGSNLGGERMFNVKSELERRFKRAGFVTNITVVNSSHLKIGLHMRTFSIDTAKHDRNLQCSPYRQKLTNLPTWSQRVEFNEIVNAVLNKYKITANVQSGPFTIREGTHCFHESDWFDQKPSWIRSNESRGWYIESVNEAEYLEEKRQSKNEAAKLKRAELKALKNAGLAFGV